MGFIFQDPRINTHIPSHKNGFDKIGQLIHYTIHLCLHAFAVFKFVSNNLAYIRRNAF